jgi:hypothetical protein
MKIITFALASVSFVLSRATAAVAIAPDHVTDDIVEELDALEELDDASADMVPDVPDGTVYKINFDDIDTGEIGKWYKYNRHDMSGVHFTETNVVNAKHNANFWSYPDSYGWSSAASSPPNVAVPSFARMKVHCYGGFLDMRSVKVMPVSYDNDLKPMTFRIRGIRNGKTVAQDEITLNFGMTEPFTFKFGKKYNKVSDVVVTPIDNKIVDSKTFTVDDLEFKVVKECKLEPKSNFRVSFDGVRTGKKNGRGAFKKHAHSGVEFVNVVALNGQKMEEFGGEGWLEAATSPPNFAAIRDEDKPAQLICPNGLLAMKSVQLMPVSVKNFQDIEVAIEGYDENDNIVASATVLLAITKMNEPLQFNFDKEVDGVVDFDKVRKVTFSKPASSSKEVNVGMDDIKYTVIQKC